MPCQIFNYNYVADIDLMNIEENAILSMPCNRLFHFKSIGNRMVDLVRLQSCLAILSRLPGKCSETCF